MIAENVNEGNMSVLDFNEVVSWQIKTGDNPNPSQLLSRPPTIGVPNHGLLRYCTGATGQS